MLSEDEFADWFADNADYDESYAAAWATYRAFFGAASVRDEAKDIARFREVYQVVYGKPPHQDFNKRWVEIIDSPAAMHSHEAWILFYQGVSHGSNN